MARTPRDVTDAELAVLQVLWDHGPATVRLLTDTLYPEGTAAQYATVQKLLERLEGKGCVERDRKGPLFRAAIGKTKQLGPGRMSRKDVWCMVRRRAADAGIETPIGCHTFRATGLMDYLTNGGRIEVAHQRRAGYAPLLVRPHGARPLQG